MTHAAFFLVKGLPVLTVPGETPSNGTDTIINYIINPPPHILCKKYIFPLSELKSKYR
jgi:hypothetical protein